MDGQDIVEKTKQFVKETLEGEGSGHDWWHIYRVHNMAVRIGRQESDVDMFVVEIAALLHDIADYKLHGGDESKGPKVAREWLESVGTDEESIVHVCHIIQHMSFHNIFKQDKEVEELSPEGKVVQDADRLDAIGAIGVGRTFAYSGHKGREMHNPHVAPEVFTSFEQYKNCTGPTINHFYEKLFLLKDLMNTKTAEDIAESRHVYMEEFVVRFKKEWEGEM